MEIKIKIFKSNNWSDYELLDTGEGEKLERFGSYTFTRPYESALWKKTLNKDIWAKADGKFWSSKEGAKKGWKMNNEIADKWPMSYQGVKFLASPTPFRHLGFFPEQATHWDFIEDKIKKSGRKIKFLNLFGYTGLASMFALRAGAEVVHLDASKKSLDWAKENQKLNPELTLGPIRYIEDDIMKFLAREANRGNVYDAIIMDPPKFGRGPKGETWKIEEDLPKLLTAVKKVLSPEPLFIILTSYTTDYSSLVPGYALDEMTRGMKGDLVVGELCIEEKSQGRIISLANTTVWSAK